MNHAPSHVIVCSAYDYEPFEKIVGNRKLNEQKMDRIIREVKSGNDMLKYYPIQVSESGDRLRIIDGQHRFAICKKLGLPIYYIVVKEEKSMADIAKINSNVEKWKATDFIECYIANGSADYRLLKDFMNKYGFNALAAAKLLKTGSASSLASNDDAIQDFYNGRTKVNHIEKAVEFADKLLLFRPFGSIFHTNFAIAVQKIIDAGTVPIEAVAAAFQKRPELLQVQANFKSYIYKLEEIFNIGKQQRTVIWAAPQKAAKKKKPAEKKMLADKVLPPPNLGQSAYNKRAGEARGKYKTKENALDGKVRLVIDAKTSIYIDAGANPETERKKYQKFHPVKPL